MDVRLNLSNGWNIHIDYTQSVTAKMKISLFFFDPLRADDDGERERAKAPQAVPCTEKPRPHPPVAESPRVRPG